MNAQIWLKGVTTELELGDLVELDIALIGGVRGLCSTKLSEDLRLGEGNWGGGAAEPFDPGFKAVSILLKWLVVWGGWLGEGTWGGGAAEPFDPGPKAVGTLPKWSVVWEGSCCGGILCESGSGNCLIPAPNGCKGWILFWLSFTLDSAAARASSRASFCWRRILSTTSKIWIRFPLRWEAMQWFKAHHCIPCVSKHGGRLKGLSWTTEHRSL